jgi:hypothetical protein
MTKWMSWTAYAAAGWSLGYGMLGLFWALGGSGFPFAPVGDDRRSGSILESTSAGVVSPIMAAVGFAGAAAGVLLAYRGHRLHRRTLMTLVGFAWVQAIVLSLVIPDYTLIAILALAPFLLVFAFTGVPGKQDGIGDILYWHRVNLIILFLGGLLWATAALVAQRRAARRCVYCGQNDRQPARWTTREATRRWGRWAVWAAVLFCLPYEVTRICWYFDYPLGISESFHQMMEDTPGMLEVGLGLAIATMLGGVLTTGLVSRWGEIYPRWILFKAGQRIPPALAIVPASLVAVVLVPGGLMNIRMEIDAGGWGVSVPGMLWLGWAVALGAATLAYHLRRRGVCRHCGRGEVADTLPGNACAS